jgi:hypothetical protein
MNLQGIKGYEFQKFKGMCTVNFVTTFGESMGLIVQPAHLQLLKLYLPQL